MKQNIYQKLHKACCEAGAVKKADKVAGMKFNHLLHDSVQTVAMEACYPMVYTLYVLMRTN